MSDRRSRRRNRALAERRTRARPCRAQRTQQHGPAERLQRRALTGSPALVEEAPERAQRRDARARHRDEQQVEGDAERSRSVGERRDEHEHGREDSTSHRP